MTEDADLSFRLAAQGHKIGYIQPPTGEEAVAIHKDWRLQRSRWLKGYIQTWDVQMAVPFAPGGMAGLKRCITLQLTLGLTLLSVAFYMPVVALLPLAWALLASIDQAPDFSLIYGLTFVFSIVVGALIGVVGAHRAGQSRVIKSAGFMPIYWLMLFPPLLRAISEMRSKRSHWHKTRHGVTGAVQNPPNAVIRSNDQRYVP